MRKVITALNIRSFIIMMAMIFGVAAVILALNGINLVDIEIIKTQDGNWQKTHIICVQRVRARPWFDV